ncbi:MAG: phosphatase PAP2 family protein [Methanospirillum sp.]|mgnify:CR=1 FL=1|nr:phosphatase PAP2 family protein [Methanospirillum sp.]
MTWEIGPVIWLQSFPVPTPVLIAASAPGSPAFFLGVVVVLAWWREREFALRLSLVFTVTAVANDIAKLLLQAPRPYWVSGAVVPYELQDSFGLPSAHAQLALTLWTVLALRARRPAFTLAAAGAVLAVGLSRVALGVHYPVDVLGGWLLGLAVLAGFLGGGPALFRAARRLTPRGRLLAAAALSLGAVGAAAAVALAAGPWAPDPSWTGPVSDLAPVSIENTLVAAGFGLGLVAGHDLDRGCRSFRSARAGLAATLLGLAVIGLAWFGVPALLPPGSPGAGAALGLVAAGIGAWCMAGAPALFCRLRLYGSPGPEPSSPMGDHA